MATSTAATFQKQLGDELVSALGGEFKFFRSSLELRRPAAHGNDVIVLAGSTKWSPSISVSFYFGRNFDRVRALEKKHHDHAMPYHIQQYSPNVWAMRDLQYDGPHTWEVDIENPPPTLAREVADAIRGIAEPFFARFSELRAARDAIAADDPWCFGGKIFWHALLKLDAALDDLDHFRKWSTCLDDSVARQATEMLAAWDSTLETSPR